MERSEQKSQKSRDDEGNAWADGCGSVGYSSPRASAMADQGTILKF
jgi:hypothetical protein